MIKLTFDVYLGGSGVARSQRVLGSALIASLIRELNLGKLETSWQWAKERRETNQQRLDCQ